MPIDSDEERALIIRYENAREHAIREGGERFAKMKPFADLSPEEWAAAKAKMTAAQNTEDQFWADEEGALTVKSPH